MSTALMRRDDSRLTVEPTESAVVRRDELLDASAVIGRVSNDVENAECAAAASRIKALLNDVEKARKSCKEPVLDFGRLIDAKAREFCAPLNDEMIRLNTAAGNYHQAKLAAQRAAEAAAKAELDAIERRRQEELAQAKTLEQRDLIDARANEEAAAAKPAIVHAPTKGQRVDEVWEIESIQEWALAREHPELVRRIEFDLPKVKTALDLLGSLPGVKAKKVVKVASVGK